MNSEGLGREGWEGRGKGRMDMIYNDECGYFLLFFFNFFNFFNFFMRIYIMNT